MSLLLIIFATLIVLALVLYAIQKIPAPFDPKVKTLIEVVIILFAAAFILHKAGAF